MHFIYQSPSLFEKSLSVLKGSELSGGHMKSALARGKGLQLGFDESHSSRHSPKDSVCLRDIGDVRERQEGGHVGEREFRDTREHCVCVCGCV